MKNKKGVWIRNVFLSILFIGAILVCVQDRMTAQAKIPGEHCRRKERACLWQRMKGWLLQADNQPPSWMRSQTG